METKINKELKSFKNKLHGNNRIWFESILVKKQYDILFMWKYTKFSNKLEKPKIAKIRGKLVKIYPPKFKHFIENIKKMQRFKVNKIKLRETIISNLLEQ